VEIVAGAAAVVVVAADGATAIKNSILKTRHYVDSPLSTIERACADV
jgi:hypothetical protein